MLPTFLVFYDILVLLVTVLVLAIRIVVFCSVPTCVLSATVRRLYRQWCGVHSLIVHQNGYVVESSVPSQYESMWAGLHGLRSTYSKGVSVLECVVLIVLVVFLVRVLFW